MSDHEFRERVLEDLVELKVSMKALVGNGQPGRIQLIEKKLSRHDYIIAIAIGGLLVIKFLLSA